MVLHASRLAHGMCGCEHGSVDADCCSLCDPLVLAHVVCDQDNYLLRCGRPDQRFCGCAERVRMSTTYAFAGGPHRLQIWRVQARMRVSRDSIRRRCHRSRLGDMSTGR